MNKSGNTLTQCLLKQFEISWQLLAYRMEGLTTEECLWEPSEKGLYVRKTEQGSWNVDFPEKEDYDIGPPNIAWITWHIDYWWSMVLNHSFGDGTLEKDTIEWKGSADHLREHFEKLKNEWVKKVSGLRDEEVAASTLSTWPLNDCPFRDIIAWLNVELMKNAAEIGYVRFLYGSRDKL